MTVEQTTGEATFENPLTVVPSQYLTTTVLVVVRRTICQDLVELLVYLNRSS